MGRRRRRAGGAGKVVGRRRRRRRRRPVDRSLGRSTRHRLRSYPPRPVLAVPASSSAGGRRGPLLPPLLGRGWVGQCDVAAEVTKHPRYVWYLSTYLL